MRKIVSGILFVVLLACLSGCACIPGGTDLSDVAAATGMSNITTGDGTFENYKATGYYTGKEIGIGVMLGPIKILELYPARSNEDLLTDVATMAKDDGAKAMINVTPEDPFGYGFIIGLYIDSAAGTGITK